MVEKREAFAPWSLTRKAGVQSATVNSDIEVPQFIQPVLDTGFVDEKGDWKGVKSSDEGFSMFSKDEAVPNLGEILTPVTAGDVWPLNMVGYRDLFIAIRPTNAGNVALTGVFAPATFPFFNLRDDNAGQAIRGVKEAEAGSGTVNNILYDGTENLTADVWNIFIIQSHFRNQPCIQIKIVNNSGGASTIEAAFMRLV